MKTSDFTITLTVDQTPKEVFDAINNVRGWWSENIEGSTNKLNDVFVYQYKDVHSSKIKLAEVIPRKKVVWEVLNNYFNFTKDETEWMGTKMIFEISRKDNQTQLRFTHQGLVPKYECYEICSKGWSNCIDNSLYNLITTGKGQPNPKEGSSNEELLRTSEGAQESAKPGSIGFLTDYYDQTREALKKSISVLSETQFRFKPADSVWSVAQCLEHIIKSEEVIFDSIKKFMEAPEVPELRSQIAITDEEVITLVTDRSNKVEAAEILKPGEKYTYVQTSWADFETVRKPVLEYITGVSLESLRSHVGDLPMGKADGYHYFLLLAAHTARHTLQIREVIANEKFPEK